MYIDVCLGGFDGRARVWRAVPSRVVHIAIYRGIFGLLARHRRSFDRLLHASPATHPQLMLGDSSSKAR